MRRTGELASLEPKTSGEVLDEASLRAVCAAVAERLENADEAHRELTLEALQIEVTATHEEAVVEGVLPIDAPDFLITNRRLSPLNEHRHHCSETTKCAQSRSARWCSLEHDSGLCVLARPADVLLAVTRPMPSRIPAAGTVLSDPRSRERSRARQDHLDLVVRGALRVNSWSHGPASECERVATPELRDRCQCARTGGSGRSCRARAGPWGGDAGLRVCEGRSPDRPRRLRTTRTG